jgi:hypothetical protein
MDDAVTTPIVVELVTALEPTIRDDFADEPAEHRSPPAHIARAEAPRDDGGPDE